MKRADPRGSPFSGMLVLDAPASLGPPGPFVGPPVPRPAPSPVVPPIDPHVRTGLPLSPIVGSVRLEPKLDAATQTSGIPARIQSRVTAGAALAVQPPVPTGPTLRRANVGLQVEGSHDENLRGPVLGRVSAEAELGTQRFFARPSATMSVATEDGRVSRRSNGGVAIGLRHGGARAELDGRVEGLQAAGGDRGAVQSSERLARFGATVELPLTEGVAGFAKLERRDLARGDGTRDGVTSAAVGVQTARNDDRLVASLGVSSTQRMGPGHASDDVRVTFNVKLTGALGSLLTLIGRLFEALCQ